MFTSLCRPRNLLCLSTLVLPLAVDAEGARRHFDCETTRQCDAAGVCEVASGQVTFSLEPLAVGSDGAGSYRLTYADSEVAMTALSEAGPFHWSSGAERHTLLASSETQLLWHRLDLSGTPTAHITFLACTLRY